MQPKGCCYHCISDYDPDSYMSGRDGLIRQFLLVIDYLKRVLQIKFEQKEPGELKEDIIWKRNPAFFT
jgi:hypothetical protein